MFEWVSKKLIDYTIKDEISELICIGIVLVMSIGIGVVIDRWITKS